jgi:diguanylate cyclase (GGDEF)-like protein
MIMIAFLFLRSYYYYVEVQDEILADAKKESRLLQDYMLSMREIYQKQFLDSGLELNDKTLGFLPAHASTLISDQFIRKNKSGFYIRNVSDNPRNPVNAADPYEMKAIGFFKSNPNEQEYFQSYTDLGLTYLQYATPIYMRESCLQCHGSKEQTLSAIQEQYDSAFNYEVGDLRGIVSIKIPQQNIESMVFQFVKKELLLTILTLIVISAIAIFIYKRTLFHVKRGEEEATEYATSDALTGLHNRHYLQSYDIHQTHFLNEDECFAVAFIDIDHFKKINDTYGHDVGDRVLTTLARVLKHATRKDDTLCRYGGEEFLIIAYNISLQQSLKKLESLRERIENLEIDIGEGVSIHITVSVGISCGAYTDSLEKVITEADKALYKAKEEGRNRICHHEPLTAHRDLEH